MKTFIPNQYGTIRLFIIMMILVFFFIVPIVRTNAVEVGDVIYFEGFESANTLKQNGDVTFARTKDYAATGMYSLSVAPTAANNYSGVALRNDFLETPMLPGGKYKLTAKAFSAKDATLGVRVETKDSSGGNTYGIVGMVKAPLAAGQWVDVTMNFAVPADHESVTAIVFHNDDQIPDLLFYLDEVKLEVTALPEPVEEPELTKVITFTFDHKTKEENLFTAASSSKLEWLKEAGIGKNDGTALQVAHISGKTYTSYDNAVRLTLSEPLPAGGIYHISVWFYAPTAGNEGKDTLTGPGVVLNDEYALSEFKLPSNFGTLPLDQWKEVNVKTPMMQKPLKTIDFRLVVNDDPKHADLWYIDDLIISQFGDLKEIVIPEWDLSLPSLTDTYKDSFLIGNVMSANQTMDAELTAMFKRHYNLVTAENDMKPQYLSPAKGKYNFSNADALINWAEVNKIKVHGHTLVWHSQSAPWLTTDTDGKPLPRAEAKANMKEYITNVAGHFQGKVISWDVVNEAFADGSGLPSDWKSALRKNSPWYLAYENGADQSKGESGADYIYDAFVLTRLTDPKATLYYNDYNETELWKREAMAMMAEELNKKWQTDKRNKQPDRLLIEALGMQAHYWTANLDIKAVDTTIARFVKAG